MLVVYSWHINFQICHYNTNIGEEYRSPFCLRDHSSIFILFGKMDFGKRQFRSPGLDNAKDVREINYNAKDARDAKGIDAKDFIYEKYQSAGFCSIGFYPVVTAGL